MANQSTYLKKRFVLIYWIYKELFDCGITFKNANKQTDTTGYSQKTRKATNKDYILKSFFFDGNRLVQKQTK